MFNEKFNSKGKKFNHDGAGNDFCKLADFPLDLRPKLRVLDLSDQIIYRSHVYLSLSYLVIYH